MMKKKSVFCCSNQHLLNPKQPQTTNSDGNQLQATYIGWDIDGKQDYAMGNQKAIPGVGWGL